MNLSLRKSRASLPERQFRRSPPSLSRTCTISVDFLFHDIGRVTGTARPERSLEVLRDCGIDSPELLALVKWHDTSLPWFNAASRGSPPSDKAWRRLGVEVPGWRW